MKRRRTDTARSEEQSDSSRGFCQFQILVAINVDPANVMPLSRERRSHANSSRVAPLAGCSGLLAGPVLDATSVDI
jgi:hypothetical protein